MKKITLSQDIEQKLVSIGARIIETQSFKTKIGGVNHD